MQPLFKIAEGIQWNHYGTHGELFYIVMLGGLAYQDKLAESTWIVADGRSALPHPISQQQKLQTPSWC